MTPARWTKKIIPALTETKSRFAEVFADTSPFMHYKMYGIFPLERFGKTVTYDLVFFGPEFGLESAKKLIPDNQEHTHIPVEVPWVGTMVHPVVGRGDQDMFQEAKLMDLLGMDQDPPGLRGRIDKNDIHWLESQPGDRDEV